MIGRRSGLPGDGAEMVAEQNGVLRGHIIHPIFQDVRGNRMAVVDIQSTFQKSPHERIRQPQGGATSRNRMASMACFSAQ